MSTTVDARGLSCPQPVMLAQKAIADGIFPVEVIVDTVTSRENVRRMAERLGCSVTIKDLEEEYKVVISK